MKFSVSPEVFERIEEASLVKAQDALNKGVLGDAENTGVLTLIKSGVMTQLNLMGMNIWNKLKTPKTLEALAAEISAEFEVPEKDCMSDLKLFVDDLSAKGFLVYE